MRLYSVEEARAALPEVIPILERLREAYAELGTLRTAFAADARGASADGSLLADPWSKEEGENRVEQLTATLQESARQLEQRGIELKDPNKGLIDFYHRREGEVVFLCFMLGESEVSYWHTLAGGFAGRQRL